ncbi:ABC transporter substrate-binding protein [Streptomyces sp. GbtcB7]|uniref:ABC transporter substrate-binding protein n=1 Tax=Streptomyces sp. GbtcB7 TaxID=2824752 RepID=UPI001C2F31D0|nr:extracellular solute-binding protein [Streptomyces sp. GbtcB7]
MHSRITRPVLALTVLACAFTTAACGGDSDDNASGSSSGPVTLEIWTDKEGVKRAAAAFNAAHRDVRVKYVNVPGSELINKLTNAHKAGDASKAPCLVLNDNRNGSMLLAQGIIRDLTQDVKPVEDKYADGAFVNLSIGGKIYAIPAMRQPMFTVIHQPTFDKYDLKTPTSWQALVTVGEKLKKHGVSVFNLAGEDPSTFMNMAWQGGARWYEVKGNAWKVNFTDGASRNAADIMQQLLDKKLVSKISYADYAAMMQEYEKGKIALRQVSTWQLASFEQNMSKSLGQWAPAGNLTVPGQSTPTSAADTSGYLVPSLCKHSKEAVEAATWLTTSADPIKAMANTIDGNGWFPAVKDPKPYLDTLVPKKLMGKHADETVPTIMENTDFADGWVYGPNSTAMYEELADQWGKAMNGDITVTSILDHMQEWTVNDLKQRGISVTK